MRFSPFTSARACLIAHTKPPGWIPLAVALALCFVVCVPGMFAQNELVLGSVDAATGASVVVPVSVRVGTGVGSAGGTAQQVQAIAFRVRYEPADAVVSLRVRRAGVLANLRPLFESSPATPGSVSWLASFDERTDEIPFRSAGGGGLDLVAELELSLAQNVLPGTIIRLDFDPQVTALSNRAGTDVRSSSAGTLTLTGAAIRVGQPRPRKKL